MVTHLFTVELEKALRADQAPIRRDGVATLARILRQEGPPSDRALATLWLYHLANHDPDEKVRAMAAVPIRLTAVWSDGLENKLYAPEFEVRLDAIYTLQNLMKTGGHDDATLANRWLAWLAGNDGHEDVRRTANTSSAGMLTSPGSHRMCFRHRMSSASAGTCIGLGLQWPLWER